MRLIITLPIVVTSLVLLLLLLLALCVSSSSSFVRAQFFGSSSPTSSKDNEQQLADDDALMSDLASSSNDKINNNKYRRIQSGRISRNIKDHGAEQVAHSVWVPFIPPFKSESNSPHVYLALSEFVTTHAGQLRMRCAVTFANNSGFEAVLGSWSEPPVPHISASWIASDLPLWEFQVFRDEQHLNVIEWGVTEMKFDPPLIDTSSSSSQSKSFVAETAGGSSTISSDADEDELSELAKKTKSLLKVVARLKPPTMVSGISKFEQRGDAHWTKLEVGSLSVTSVGFTSLIRPWGDTPTFWVGAEHLATTLPATRFRTGIYSVVDAAAAGAAASDNTDDSIVATPRQQQQKIIIKKMARVKIQLNVIDDVTKEEILPPMSCEHPDVVIFIKCFDQAPPNRFVKVSPQSVTSKSFELVYDVREATESFHTKFSWVVTC